MGVAGNAFTTTVVVPAGDVQIPMVTETLYVPAIAAVTGLSVGFCNDDVNPPGPVQLYVAPNIVDAVKLIDDPIHTGELLPAVGATGGGLTIRSVVPGNEVQPPDVIVTL